MIEPVYYRIEPMQNESSIMTSCLNSNTYVDKHYIHKKFAILIRRQCDCVDRTLAVTVDIPETGHVYKKKMGVLDKTLL